MEVEIVEGLEQGLYAFILLLKVVLEALAALIVSWGLLRTLQHAFRIRRKKGSRQPILAYPFEFSEIRLTFGLWLALALEFQLAADILSTTVSPSFEELGKLALIAVIRTFLNYFLNQELEKESEDVKLSARSQAEVIKGVK
ncbi:DUF1622 domain-containing protein [Halomicronema sp. CCY15110]|uniref:DUF1622 domain-containing protein n=1 Tax=Halomicronema sp. CCY15110 TaxID=2767773 RepID=UPI0019507066|nr:DUF1622 domain-containing protein [Halomicronema sp. CCY15110]